MNSDVTAIAPAADSMGTSYDLLDIYAPGKHLCKDVYQLKFAEWNKYEGTVIIPEFSRFNSRRNFNGLRLRGVTVIDRDNLTSDDVDGILSAPGREQGVVFFIKYHYALLSMLREYHNFTIKYRIARGWAGRLKSGYRLGLLGILSRNEADVATTGVFQRLNRHAEFDFIHHSWEFSAGFLYRMTPLLRDSSGTGSFFTPFDNMVWMVSAVTIIAVLLVLKLASLIITRLKRYEPNSSFITYAVDIIATVAQQGVSNQVSNRVSIRIIIFSLLFLTLLLYNYYTSSVVGSLLSSPGKGPQTIKEITDSPLKLSFLDIGYHKVLFTETKDPSIREMYRKKVQPSREGKQTIPVFTDVLTAVPYLKHGGYAFHCEMTEAFQDIANQFDAYEICELRTGVSLFSDLKLLGMILPKRSMYTELFKTTLMRAQEVGLIKRTLKIHRPEKPICQVGSRIHPVELYSVKMAFSVLGVGFGVSLILLFIERLWYNSVLKRESMNFIN
ncbi:ionotropic receptor 75a [Ochlerotatus camptorhynchus]|uniref:ionotropic receptor 75a n=1 Tax=Ochlerotatus camptorhynchus TaxID=644619 RepID=UPI0031D53FCC